MTSIKKYLKINRECSKSEFKVEQKEGKKKWTNEAMHRQFTRQIKDFASKKRWQWFKRRLSSWN